MWRRRRTAAGATGDGSIDRAREFGWNVHRSQESWTGKVDVKATIVLTLEVGVVSAIVLGTSFGADLADLCPWRSALVRAAGAVTFLGVLLALGAVFPTLGHPRRHVRDHQDNLIYFGHLRHWTDRGALAQRMLTMTPSEEVDQLAGQVVAMSRGNWRKHILLRWALTAGALGLGLVGTAALWP